MTKPLIQIDDEVREMTDEEIAAHQLIIDENEAKKADIAAKAKAKEALLERLGITADEAALLVR